MKTICITGAIEADLQYIDGVLTQAGIEPARSAQRDTSMTIDFWHEQVESRIKELSQQKDTVELGRVWEQIASDIFVANMRQETWGWADTRSRFVLDFWQAFDPQIRFVLVACSAQRYIAHALAAGEPIDSVKSLMAEWVKQQLQLLQFLHRYPQKTILVDIEQCIDQPAGLIKACQQRWQLNLSKVHFPAQPAKSFTTLEQFLARELSQTDHQWQELQNELWTSATSVGSQWKNSSQIDVFDAVKAYRADQAKYIESQVTSAERRELSKQLEIAHATATVRKNEVDAAKAELAVVQAALVQKTSEANPLATQLKDVQEESDLLLTQLHQVREELEKVFLENQDFKKMISEIEPLQLKAQDLTNKLEVANTEVTKHKKELDAAKGEAVAAQVALAQKTSEANPLASQLKDAQEESDLLLAQLHQVQEELEHYFLKYQDSNNTLESNEQRWKRMLQRQPDYFDLESIEVVHFGDPKSVHIDWRLKGLDAAGRLIPELRLTSTEEGGVACLELPRKMGEQPVFVRWPLAAANKATLTVAVVGNVKTGRERADILMQLGRSDWDLVQVILNVLINEIQAPGLLKFPKEFASDKVLESFKLLKAKLAQLPAVFRFDEIKLKREQVNPDYEHLWLDFRHVAIGNKRLLDFDFRVSCANVRPKTFGEYPKLEFPETSGRSAITGWFDEAYDDFGAKFELRFSLPQSMDLQVWEQLPEPDRLFLSSLINQIPALMSELESSGIEVKRGWADWQQLAKDVRRILAICTVSKTEFADLPPLAPKTKKVASTPRVGSSAKLLKNKS